MPRVTDFDTRMGAVIRRLRRAKEMPQAKLGEHLGGITFQQVQKYETGKNRLSAAHVPALCEALDVKPTELFQMVDEEFDQVAT